MLLTPAGAKGASLQSIMFYDGPQWGRGQGTQMRQLLITTWTLDSSPQYANSGEKYILIESMNDLREYLNICVSQPRLQWWWGHNCGRLGTRIRYYKTFTQNLLITKPEDDDVVLDSNLRDYIILILSFIHIGILL